MLTRSRSGLPIMDLSLVGDGAPAPINDGGSLAGNVSLRASSRRRSRRSTACNSCWLFIEGNIPPEHWFHRHFTISTVSIAYKRLLRQRWEEAGGQFTNYTRDGATTLIVIAGEWVEVQTKQMTQLKELRSKLGGTVRRGFMREATKVAHELSKLRLYPDEWRVVVKNADGIRVGRCL
jgi:hypothetical protein